MKACRDVDDVLLFNRQDWARVVKAGELWKFLRSLGKVEYDAVIDLQGLLRSGLCTWFAKSSVKAGFADAREGAGIFYNRRISVPEPKRHAVERNLHVASVALGMDLEYVAPTFHDNESAREEAECLLGQPELAGRQHLLAIAPTSRWISKSWPEDFFIDTLNRLIESSGQSVGCWLLGSGDERATGERIASAVGPHVVNLMGRTSLPTLLALLRRSDILLTNDSGPMHVAAVLDVPTVALFGPTDPGKTGPYGCGHKVFRSDVECSPCFHRVCPLPQQICRDRDISAEAVSRYLHEHLIPRSAHQKEIPS